jgi:hypothetical protein
MLASSSNLQPKQKKTAQDYLRNDRDTFLTLSLNKFSLQETLALTRQSLKEINEENDKQIQRSTPFGSSVQERIAVAKSHRLAIDNENDEVSSAAKRILVAAFGADYAPAPALDKYSARVHHLTNCLWRYLPLRKMTVYHLWSLLKAFKEFAAAADGEGRGAAEFALLSLRSLLPEVVRAIDAVVHDTHFDGSDLESVSASLQVLASFPPHAHGEEAAPKEIAEVSLNAIVAFSLVPHVVESSGDLHSVAAELAMKLQLGNIDTVGFGAKESVGVGADGEELTEFQRLRQLEEDGASAASTLLHRHCRELVSADLTVSGTVGVGLGSALGNSTKLETKFDLEDVGRRTSELLAVLAKMTHDSDLLVSTAPIVFEAIQASVKNGTELTEMEAKSICVILG